MKLARIASILVPLAVTSAACDKGNAGADTTSTAAQPVAAPASASAPVQPAHSAHRELDRPRVMHAGMPGMFLRACDDLELKDAQKTQIDAIAKRLHDQVQPGAQRKEMSSTLAVGIKAGKLDTAKLTALEADADKAADARRDAQAQALDDLHAALEPAQRKAVVDKLRQGLAAREAHHAEHMGDAGKPDAAEFTKRRLVRMTKALDLDAAQRNKVEALLGKGEHAKGPNGAGPDAAKQRMTALLDAFASDTFDAKKLDAGPAGHFKPSEGIAHYADFLGKLLPILKPEQRDKLAAQIERPRGSWMGRPAGDMDDPMAPPPFEAPGEGEPAGP